MSYEVAWVNTLLRRIAKMSADIQELHGRYCDAMIENEKLRRRIAEMERQPRRSRKKRSR
jgi:hypothetical protein